MKLDNILCPIDFSESSQRAVEHASRLASSWGAKLHFVYVYEPNFSDGYLEGMPTVPIPADLDPLRDRISEVKPTLDGIAFTSDLLLGLPATSIVQYAVQEKIDLIVMATHGRSGIRRALLGSVVEAVMRHAPCPVLTLCDAALEAVE